MRYAIARRLGAVLFLSVLVSCESGGGGPGSVSLKTEADVAREVSNLTFIVETSFGTATSGARSAGARAVAARFQSMHSRGTQARAKSTSVTPKAAETIECGSGFYTFENFFEVQRELPLFDVTPTLDYYAEDNHDCTYTEGTYSEFYDGKLEDGGNGAYAEGTVQSPRYDYFKDGSGSTPNRYIEEDTGYKFSLKALGRGETKDTGVAVESREIFDFDVTLTSDGDSVHFGIKTGASGDPLIVVDNSGGDGSVSLDGPITYDSDFCDSGKVNFTTVQNLTVGEDISGQFLNGGELLLESGSGSVELVFAGDGSVTYTFENGDSGSLTLAELRAAEAACFAFPGGPG